MAAPRFTPTLLVLILALTLVASPANASHLAIGSGTEYCRGYTGLCNVAWYHDVIAYNCDSDSCDLVHYCSIELHTSIPTHATGTCSHAGSLYAAAGAGTVSDGASSGLLTRTRPGCYDFTLTVVIETASPTNVPISNVVANTISACINPP